MCEMNVEIKLSTDEVMVDNLFSGNALYTQEYFLQSDICRLCWSRNAHRDLLSANCENDTKIKNELVFKVHDCLDIDINGENVEKFPRKLCETCYEKVENFYEFRSFCKEYDRKLREIILQTGFSAAETDLPATDLVKTEIVEETTNLSLSKSNSLDNLLDSLDPIETYINAVQEPLVSKKKNNKYKRKKSSSYCNICHADFHDEDSFVAHNSEAHGIESNGYFKCFGCDKRFKKRSSRLSHEMLVCKQLKEGYKCNICYRFLPKRRMYENHMKGHKKNEPIDLPVDIFQCAKCMTKFTTKMSLILHLKSHEAETSYVCDACGRVFSRLDYLNKHVAIHTGLRRYQCPQCPYRSTQPSALTVHIRKHTGERPYQCEVCPQRCVSSSNLAAHRRRHLQLQNYQCMICPKKFGYKSSLEDHIAATHERSRPHCCALCGATYTRQRGLRRHQQIKHRMEPKECGRKTKITDSEEKNNKNAPVQEDNLEKSVEFT